MLKKYEIHINFPSFLYTVATEVVNILPYGKEEPVQCMFYAANNIVADDIATHGAKLYFLW